MNKIENKLNEITKGEVGLLVFSPKREEMLLSINEQLVMPLASAGKVAIAFVITKMVENKQVNWTDIIHQVPLNPAEDSNILYPYLKSGDNLLLQDAVEVMIACHDSFVANSVVEYVGGWDKINHLLATYVKSIHVTSNPRDVKNIGSLEDMMTLLQQIYKGYLENAILWLPIIKGFVRQQGEIKGIVQHELNHMTGGLANVVIDVGIIGTFTEHPLLYCIGAKELPDRNVSSTNDEIIEEAVYLLYKENLNDK